MASVFWVYYPSTILKKKKPSITNIIWHFVAFERKNRENNGRIKKTNDHLHQDNAPFDKSIATMAKLHE